MNLLSGGGFSVGSVVDVAGWFVGLDDCCFARCLMLWVIVLVVIGFGFACCLGLCVAVLALWWYVGFVCVWVGWLVGAGIYGCAGVSRYTVGLADCVAVVIFG